MKGQSDIYPPRWPLKFLRYFVKDEYLEEIEGDMGEIFQDNLLTLSFSKAKRLYAWETLKLLRPILIKKIEGGAKLNNNGMFKNYVKIALRNIKKHKVYSFINVFGLALGIAASSLILLWVQDELSYDNFHNNLDKIHRVVLNVPEGSALAQRADDSIDRGVVFELDLEALAQGVGDSGLLRERALRTEDSQAQESRARRFTGGDLAEGSRNARHA